MVVFFPKIGYTDAVVSLQHQEADRMAKLRLDRFFSSQDLLSRSEIHPLLRSGAILVNGIPAKSGEQKIDTDSDTVSLHGEVVPYKPYIYLMLNKPKGVVSATDDKTHTTVLDLVPPGLYRSGLFPAGRLDRDTVGFVLLTDDGNFAHEILSPKRHVEKAYHVRLDGPLSTEAIAALEKGATLADGTVCRPARIRLLEGGERPLAEIVLVEGKYHQVKRMFGVVGLGVDELKRVRIGGLCLDETLADGECREILHNEVEKILVK